MLVVLLSFVLGSEDGHFPTFWLLLYVFRILGRLPWDSKEPEADPVSIVKAPKCRDCFYTWSLGDYGWTEHATTATTVSATEPQKEGFTLHLGVEVWISSFFDELLIRSSYIHPLAETGVLQSLSKHVCIHRMHS